MPGNFDLIGVEGNICIYILRQKSGIFISVNKSARIESKGL